MCACLTGNQCSPFGLLCVCLCSRFECELNGTMCPSHYPCLSPSSGTYAGALCQIFRVQGHASPCHPIRISRVPRARYKLCMVSMCSCLRGFYVWCTSMCAKPGSLTQCTSGSDSSQLCKLGEGAWQAIDCCGRGVINAYAIGRMWTAETAGYASCWICACLGREDASTLGVGLSASEGGSRRQQNLLRKVREKLSDQRL